MRTVFTLLKGKSYSIIPIFYTFEQMKPTNEISESFSLVLIRRINKEKFEKISSHFFEQEF